MAWPKSTRLAAELARSGHAAIGGITVLDGPGAGRDLRVTDGSVTEDARQAVRRSLDATLIDDGGLWPLDVSSPLYPGTPWQAWRGVRYPDGSEERVPLGVFLVGDPEATTSGGRRATLTVTCEDRSAWVARNRGPSAFPVPSGSLLSTVVSSYLADRLPGCPAVVVLGADVIIATATLLPSGQDADPWTALTGTGDEPGLVTRCGRRLWFGVDGPPVLAPLSSSAEPYATPGWELTARVGIDSSRVFGGVVVTSTPAGTDTPLRAVRTSDSVSLPFSAGYYFAAMDGLDTQAAVDAAADDLAPTVVGLKASASWTCPPDPTIQAGDLITPTGMGLLLTGTYEVQRVTTPLLTGRQSIETVERSL